jgi:membrane associated rhomboid family serine protease
MRSAAVGWQCPECVSGGRRGQATPRTVLGGRLVTRPGQLTTLLIVANVICFLIEVSNRSVEARYDMQPIAVAHGQYYRLITDAFLHANTVHLLFNMWALYVVGPALETMLGRLRFAIVYVGSALGGSALVYLLAPASQESLGASAAIFGLFGGLFVVARRVNANVGGIGFVLIANLVITFAVPGISWQGHIGGLVTGSAMTAAYAYAPRGWRNAVAVAVPAVAVVLIAVVIAARTSALP